MAQRFTVSVMSDLRPGPRATDWQRHYAEYLEEARLADSLGYRTMRVPESHGHDDGMMPDPLTILAATAPVTKSIRLMTYAIPLAFHSARQIVEQAAIVDLLSGGRLELGLGAGGSALQFDLFGVSMRDRGARAERRIGEIRSGLAEGQLYDGPGGRAMPVSPPPSQSDVPVYYGGLSRPAVDRAVRLADGCLPYDYVDPEVNLGRFYRELLVPALERHGRRPEEFFLSVGVCLWVADDPDRDWRSVIEPALAYRQRKYLEWAGSESALEGMTSQALRKGVLLGTAEEVADRLRKLHQQVPFDDIAFWYRLPGVSHEAATAHLERVARELIPLLAV